MMILSSMKDVDLFKEQINCDGYAESYAIIQMHPELELKYLFDYALPEIDLYEMVQQIASSWHKDFNNTASFYAKEVNIGAALNKSLMIQFSHSLRYYFALKEHGSNYKKILLSNNISRSLKKVAGIYSNKIQYFSNPDEIGYLISSPDSDEYRSLPSFNFFSFCLRLLQFPFSKFFRNKVLVFNRNYKNNLFLNLNSLNAFKAFCLRDGNSFFNLADRVFPKALNQNYIENNIKEELDKFELSDEIVDNLKVVFSKTILSEYISCRASLIRMYCSYLELFNFYKPAMVFVDAISPTFSQVLIDLARAKSIPIAYMRDGIDHTFDTSLLPKNYNEDSNKIDFYFATSSLANKKMKNQLGNSSKVIAVKHKALNYQSILSKEKIKNKCPIIMFPYHITHSPYATKDKRYKYVIDVVRTLNSLGYSRILIKIKAGIDHNQKKEIELLRELLDKYRLNNIDFLYGSFFSLVQNAELVIGQMGTAFFEAISNNIPYYIYEPQSLGFTSAMKKKFFIKNRNISLKLVDLKKNISNGIPSSFVDDDNFNSVEISDIDFVKLIDQFQSINDAS